MTLQHHSNRDEGSSPLSPVGAAGFRRAPGLAGVAAPQNRQPEFSLPFHAALMGQRKNGVIRTTNQTIRGTRA